MKLNMGSFDRVIRVVIAVLIALAYFTNQISGTFAVVALIIAVVFLITGFVGFCPLYKPFGISTRKKAAA
ncbi:MAG: DUF2892 domain-containing protein [Cyclobacteriaceae bacterium]